MTVIKYTLINFIQKNLFLKINAASNNLWRYGVTLLESYIMRKHSLTEKVANHLHKLLKKAGELMPPVQHGSQASVHGTRGLDYMILEEKDLSFFI